MSTRITSVSKHHPLHRRRRSLIRVPFGAQRLLAVLEGLEGGFAIGAGIIVALAISGIERDLLLITVVITLAVSGFNSASVKYSSEHYLDELDGREKRSAFKHYFMPAFIEFVAYAVISFISIIPLLFVDSLMVAIGLSVTITLAILFAAGFWRGYMLHMPRLRDACETLALGSGIVFVGALSGFIVKFL